MDKSKLDYYDGTKLLSMKDLDGKTPEIFLVTTNRSAGKTVYFSRLLINKFLKNKEKFCLIYRFKYELKNCEDKFFKEVGNLFFKDYTMQSETIAAESFLSLYLINKKKPEEKLYCGYAVSLNGAENLKRYSHLLSDVKRIFLDEFQSESNKYCADEIKKFQSLHFSIARGGGEMVRYVPVYMCSNPVSILNPYYTALGITPRLKEDTKFLRGHGYVLEQGFNENTANEQLKSQFNRAFNEDKYLNYSIYGNYLNDNKSFIEKPAGRNRYICTIKYKNNDYGVREYYDSGIIYCSSEVDTSFKLKLSLTTDDHQINYVMIKNNPVIIQNFRFYFERGCFRFQDLNSKEVITELIGYR